MCGRGIENERKKKSNRIIIAVEMLKVLKIIITLPKCVKKLSLKKDKCMFL